MSKFKLFSPLNILIFVAGVLVALAICLLTIGQGVGQFLFGRSYAQSELRDYVASVLREQVNGVSCQAFDTDKNGYVSCDYTINREPGITRSAECAVWGVDGFLNRGCKTRLPLLNGQRN
ncbi:hypothetical protein [Anthocerotibacter panamensis]|uniref:hypothetical protein n=1 Tax=Anthocerotibacter panamensis TaxID=2857077 RepID=UPI001C4062C8|nr:hypothetical protein [Anthocerotibacter panamensis]